MPDSFLPLASLLAAIVPGFLYLQGYYRGRSQPAVPDVFLVAKATFVSLAFLSIAWLILWFDGRDDDVAGWIRDGKLDEHIGASLALGWVLFVVAYGAGLAIGWTVDRFGRPTTSGVRGRVGGFLNWAGFLRERTIWATLLDEEFGEPRLIEIRLADGRTIVGAFDGAAAARRDLSEVLLSETFVVDAASGELVPQGRFLYLRGEDIREIAAESS